MFSFLPRRTVAVLFLALCSSLAFGQNQSSNSAFEQGIAAMRSGDAAQAASDFQQFLRSHPGSAEGYFNLGLALEQLGQFEPSLTALQKAGSLQPDMRGVGLFTGIVQYKLNHLAEAHEELSRNVKTDSANAAAWMWLGIVELAQGQVDAAAGSLDKAATLDPKNQDILYHRGRAHLLVSKESYSEMFRIDPDSWRVHEVLGQADAEAFRTGDAITEFNQAAGGAPHEPGLHEELGDACWTAGKLQEADDAYTEESKIDPYNAVVLYKLGSLRVTRSDPASGVPLLERALTLDPTLTDVHYYLGKGDAALGNQQAAIKQFQLATNPSSAEDLRIMSWYQLAMLYRGLHQTQEAGEALAEFRALRAARDQRQQNRLNEKVERRAELPLQETIP
jgi:tetratricopeptide (TPR) repeat protein